MKPPLAHPFGDALDRHMLDVGFATPKPFGLGLVDIEAIDLEAAVAEGLGHGQAHITQADHADDGVRIGELSDERVYGRRQHGTSLSRSVRVRTPWPPIRSIPRSRLQG